MRSIAFGLLVLATAPLGAQSVATIDLTVPSATKPQSFAATPGAVQVTLTNALPGKKYEVTDSSAKTTKTFEVPALGDVSGTPACTDTDLRAKQALKLLTKEQSIPAVLSSPVVAECEEKDVKKISDKIHELTRVDIGSYDLSAGGSVDLTIKRSDDATKTWTASIKPQGAVEQAKKGTPDRLDSEMALVDKHPSLIVMRCSFESEKCASDELFINADQDSAVYITDVPKGQPVTIRATASEYFPCPAVRYNFATYSASSDTIVVSVHMKRNFLGLFPLRLASVEKEAAAHYGLESCPGDGRSLQKRQFALFRGEASRTSPSADPRLIVQEPPVNTLPLLLRGRSELAKIDIEFADQRKTFVVPVRYQRFWLDAGGFFVFARHVDEKLELEDFKDTDTTRKIKRVWKDTSTDPVTGIVVNLHPGNFPAIAFQFGLASNQGRMPSYYLGTGLRARSIGKRGLATIAAGIAMQQEDRFPDVKNGETYRADSPRLVAAQRYGFNPYISISFGFSFGGVSEKADVKAAVSAE